jgi:hypothetical protein
MFYRLPLLVFVIKDGIMTDDELRKLADESLASWSQGKMYLTATGDCNPRGYNWEEHRDFGDTPCSVCGRPFSTHTPDEFCDCRDALESNIP